MNNKVLVTGAGGFIGSHLVEELVTRGVRVRAFVHYNSRNDLGNIELLDESIKSSIEIFKGDIIDPYSVMKAVSGCRIVYHLAALIGIPYSYVTPHSYVETNIVGTLNVLEASLKGKVDRVVHTSTSETYGTAEYVPIDEKHPLKGQSPYAASKIGADKLTESYYLSYKLPVTIIRPFNTYGPRQSTRAIIPTIITQAITLKSHPLELGLLTPVRDFSYVKDTVKGFVKMVEHSESIGETINIGSGQGITIKELAKIIINKVNKDNKVVLSEERIRPPESEVMQLICNNTKARELINWEPETPLEEGLEKTIDFIKENIHSFKIDNYHI